MTTILSIDTALQKGISKTLKESLGATIGTVCRGRARELMHSPTNSPTGLRDKAIMAWLKRKALRDGKTDFFEKLHLDFWSNEGGSVFSENCDHRFHDLFLARQSEDFDLLRKLWNERQPNHIVEFGCNSGLLLNYLATELSAVESATGIDVNAAQIEKNRMADVFQPMIDFQCADANDWLSKHGQASTMFVTNGGVLEYFSPDKLGLMLSHIASQLKPAIFYCSEPVAADHDWNSSTDSIPFGEELSFSHNYPHLFESAGFDVVHSRAVDYDQWKMVVTIAVV